MLSGLALLIKPLRHDSKLTLKNWKAIHRGVLGSLFSLRRNSSLLPHLSRVETDFGPDSHQIWALSASETSATWVSSLISPAPQLICIVYCGERSLINCHVKSVYGTL